MSLSRVRSLIELTFVLTCVLTFAGLVPLFQRPAMAASNQLLSGPGTYQFENTGIWTWGGYYAVEWNGSCWCRVLLGNGSTVDFDYVGIGVRLNIEGCQRSADLYVDYVWAGQFGPHTTTCQEENLFLPDGAHHVRIEGQNGMRLDSVTIWGVYTAPTPTPTPTPSGIAALPEATVPAATFVLSDGTIGQVEYTYTLGDMATGVIGMGLIAALVIAIYFLWRIARG